MRTSRDKPSHLKILLKKNWKIWKADRWSAFCGIFFPICCVMIMAIVHKGWVQDLPDASYFNDPNHLYQFNGTLNATDQNLLSACSISNKSVMIGLAPEGDSLVVKLKDIFGKNIL